MYSYVQFTQYMGVAGLAPSRQETGVHLSTSQRNGPEGFCLVLVYEIEITFRFRPRNGSGSDHLSANQQIGQYSSADSIKTERSSKKIPLLWLAPPYLPPPRVSIHFVTCKREGNGVRVEPYTMYCIATCISLVWGMLSVATPRLQFFLRNA